MSAWVLVPCLVVLRSEFNAVVAGRDKGADGSIGDSVHSPASDHTPDEDSAVLRDHDADSKNEVHALDIDSTGPWPGGPAWFDQAIKGIVERHRTGEDNRLHYVIWNRQIANRDIDNWRWRTYVGSSDPHTNHAHFSSRYTTAQESDTSPWGLIPKESTMSVQDVREFFASAATAVTDPADATAVNRSDRNTLASVLRYAWGLNGPEQTGWNLAPARLDRIETAVAEIKAALPPVG